MVARGCGFKPDHDKDLAKDKWVKIDDWFDAAAAEQEILASVGRYAMANKSVN